MKKFGGALGISICLVTIIKNCTFIDNYSLLGGSALYYPGRVNNQVINIIDTSI